jgi:flagellar biogenesis protein FliO
MTERAWSMERDDTMTSTFARQGLAGWLLQAWKTRRTLRERVGRRMQLVETLPVGAKRQLMLVRCGEEYFLVGGGLESISTIVKVEGPAQAEEGERCN